MEVRRFFSQRWSADPLYNYCGDNSLPSFCLQARASMHPDVVIPFHCMQHEWAHKSTPLSLPTTGTFESPPRDYLVTSLSSLPTIFSFSCIQPSSPPQTHQLYPPVTFLLTCLHGWFLYLYRSWLKCVLLREAFASPPHTSSFVSVFPSLLWNISLSFVCPPSSREEKTNVQRAFLFISMSIYPLEVLKMEWVSHAKDSLNKMKKQGVKGGGLSAIFY